MCASAKFPALGTIVALLVACGPVGEVPSATQPPRPDVAVDWSSIEWGDEAFQPDSPANGLLESVAEGPAGYVAVGWVDRVAARDGLVSRSSDGLNWEILEPPELSSIELQAVVTVADAYVAVGTAVDLDGVNAESVVLRSLDGRTWDEVHRVTGRAGSDAYATGIEAGPGDAFAFGYRDGLEAWASRSADGRAWQDVDLSRVERLRHLDDVSASGEGWILLGREDDAGSLVWRSRDGDQWSSSVLDPRFGATFVGLDLVVGRWSTVILGIQPATGCASIVASCAANGIALWSQDAVTWAQLPAESPLALGNAAVQPADDAGFLILRAADAWLTADGWAPVVLGNDRSNSSVLIHQAIVIEDQVVAVGESLGAAASPWAGRATLTR